MEVNADPRSAPAPDVDRRLAEACAVEADLARFVATTRSQLADSLGPDAITTEYGPDGVLSALRVDADARRQLTEEQLLAQLEAALVASPAAGVANDPQAAADRLHALVSAAPAPAADPRPRDRDEVSTPEGSLTLLSVDGRPVGVRTRPGWILSEPSAELGVTIVRLARQAAVAAADGRGTV